MLGRLEGCLVGCSDGLMFRYFKSKSDLLFAIIKQGKINSQKEIEENFSFSSSVEEQIYKIMEVYIDKLKEFYESKNKKSKSKATVELDPIERIPYTYNKEFKLTIEL